MVKIFAYYLFNGTDGKLHRRKVEYDMIATTRSYDYPNADTCTSYIFPYHRSFIDNIDVYHKHVFTRNDFHLDIDYAVFLSEEDDELAMRLLRDKIKDDIDKLSEEWKKCQNFIDQTYIPVSELEYGFGKESEKKRRD